MMAVKINDLSFAYNDKLILKEINMELNYNEITLLSGASGSGKTTLIHLISGVIPNIIKGKMLGNIYINDNDIKNKKLRDISKEVGIVLQNADNQIINQTVEDEIAFGLENYNYDNDEISKRIDYVTNLLKLDKKAKTRILSGGQKQRLITASILAVKPKILILDEPLANLDKEGTKILMDSLLKLKNDGYAILIVEHRIDVLKEYIDKIYDIKDGRINKIDNVDEYILSSSKKIEYKKIIKESNVLLSLNNISYITKDKKTLFENINLDIEEGKRILILGENGAGKSTLIKIISGIIKPKGGKITYYLDLKLKHNKKIFKNVGIVYQNPNYELFMPTVYKEMKFSAFNDEYLNKYIKLFDLEDILDKHPSSLSEGQKRKLTVALTLASKPKILILDEPTVGQDFISLSKMVNIINQYIEENNATLITITHDKRCAASLADIAYVLESKNLHKIDIEKIDNYFIE